MVSLTEKTTIPLPAAEVWLLLNDPALVASCIPGAQLAPDQGDGLWRGSIRVKFGPTVAVFRGDRVALVTEGRDDRGTRCRGRGDLGAVTLAVVDVVEPVEPSAGAARAVAGRHQAGLGVIQVEPAVLA